VAHLFERQSVVREYEIWQSSRSIAGIAGFGGIETGRLKWRGRTGAPNRTLRESNASRNAARGRAWSWNSGGAIRWDSAIPARNHQHADASFFYQTRWIMIIFDLLEAFFY
jgi:hypothetical protein